MDIQKGLQMYRKHNRIIDAVKFTKKHIVKCFESSSTEAEKIRGLKYILNSFASVFSRLGVPAEYENRIEYLVHTLLHANMVDEVLELTGSPCPASLKVPFLELRMRAYHIAGNMDGFWNVIQEWEVNKLFAYSETAYIFGTRLMDSGSLQKAIEAFTDGVSLAESPEKKERMQNKCLEAEERMKNEREQNVPENIPQAVPENVQEEAAQDGHQAAAQEDAERREKIEKELLAEEGLTITAESKGKDKKKKESVSKDKKAVEVADEVAEEVAEEVHESDGKVLEEKEEEKGRRSTLAEKREPQKFELTISVTMEKLDNVSFLGSAMLNTTKVNKSFIVAEKSHIENIQELVCLCLSHDNLLKIDQSLKIPDDGSLILLTSEDVCSIQYFFKNKLSQMSPNSRESNEAWWKFIKTTFWKVFRGVIRGLIHLFVRGKSCGHLVFNVFVTLEGEGRILPSMEKLRQKEDLKGLVDLMKTVIKLPVPQQSDLSFLPHHLNHFFKLIDELEPSETHLAFLIDHPYFWNVTEKVDFTRKLRKLIKQSSKAELLRQELMTLKSYQEWWNKLNGVYHEVYVQAAKRKTIKQYKNDVDIVRYFGSVYTHINGYEYKAARKCKRFTDEMIESDLTMMFPNFYVDMFYCLCLCICDGTLIYEDFKSVSTVSHEVPEEEDA